MCQYHVSAHRVVCAKQISVTVCVIRLQPQACTLVYSTRAAYLKGHTTLTLSVSLLDYVKGSFAESGYLHLAYCQGYRCDVGVVPRCLQVMHDGRYRHLRRTLQQFHSSLMTVLLLVCADSIRHSSLALPSAVLLLCAANTACLCSFCTGAGQALPSGQRDRRWGRPARSVVAFA